MTTDPEIAEYVLEQLVDSGEITTRKMFGGIGIYVDDVFCSCISSKSIFYLRVGPSNIEDFKELGMAKFPGGKGAGMPYYEVPEEVLEDSGVLSEWVAKAKIAAIAAKKK